MKKIYIGSSNEILTYYQNTLLYNFLNNNGYELVKEPSDSEIIIYNALPYNRLEEKIALLSINYYLQKYPAKEFIVFGSLADMLPSLQNIQGVKSIGLKNLLDLDTVFKITHSITDTKIGKLRYFSSLNVQSLDLSTFGYDEYISESFAFTNIDYLITIQDIKSKIINIDNIKECYSEYNYLEDRNDTLYIHTCLGCNFNCSYCIINTNEGCAASTPLNVLTETIQGAVNSGIKTIFLLDQDTGSYGIDIGIDYSDLLNSINAIKGDFKVKIYFVEPGMLEKKFEKIHKSFFIDKLIYINIPIQTTSQEILRLMNRSYNIAHVLEIVTSMKKLNPEIVVETIFMFGFPTETLDHLYDYISKIGIFDIVQFLLYSEWNSKGSSQLKKLSISEVMKRYMIIQLLKQKYPKKIDSSEIKDYKSDIKRISILY